MHRNMIRNAGMSLALCAGLAFGATFALADYADGTYEAEGKGIGGAVPVTVTIENGAIASVEVGDNGETQGIGSKAIEQLPEAIVAANGVEGVDAVSGASVTSKAIFTAVEDALAQADAGEAAADEAEDAAAGQWAFPFTMDSEELGIGTIYYTAAYFAAADETTVNPLDPDYAPYTAEALAEIADAADTYAVQDAPAEAVLGISAYGAEAPFWYDAAGAEAITSSAAPLAIDAETGEVTVGDVVVAPLQWALPLVFDSEELGLGSIYYTAAYFAAANETTVNPFDPDYAPYTADALAEIAEAGFANGAAAPAGAFLGISAYGAEVPFWYDADAAAAITSSAAPLAVDAETGEVAVGDAVVTPIVAE